MYKIVRSVLALMILAACSDDTLSSNDLIKYGLDINTVMYCKIDSDNFYGKISYLGEILPDLSNNDIAIYAIFNESEIELQLRRNMRYKDTNFFRIADLVANNNFYNLDPSEPYDLSLNFVSDTLVTGEFYGVFVCDSVADTAYVKNGTFLIYPKYPSGSNSSLSMMLNDTYYSTTHIYENFGRYKQTIVVNDSSYLDSLNARFYITVKNFTNNFIKEFPIIPLYSDISVFFSVQSPTTGIIKTYYEKSGYINITSMENYFEDNILKERISKAEFELEIFDLEGETLNVTDGHFSSTGF